MALNNIKIIQHNVLQWTNRRISLSNTYRTLDPDVILINSHCLTDEKYMKIAGYHLHKKNSLNNKSDGTAIAIKRNTEYKLIDDFISDLLAIEITTSTGKIIIATLYQPPTRNYIPIPDFIKLFRRYCPVYMIADLNANHPTLGYNHTNIKGRQINTLIQNRLIQHIGPEFPTFYTQRRGTTPDIILTNHRTYHNTYITPGPLTTSDHVPVILTISITPILIPVTPRPNYRKANWKRFKARIMETLHNNNLNIATLETIDYAVDNWHQAIDRAMQDAIPLTIYKRLPSPQHSDSTKLIITLFSSLQTYSKTNGWNIQSYRYYRNLQSVLQESLITENNEHWSKLLHDMANIYKDTACFWKKIKHITNNTNTEPHYLKNKDNRKVYTNEEKEEVHREYWKDIFKEDEVQQNEDTEIIYEYMQNNLYRSIPYNNADITRLGTGILDETITEDEVKNIIKNLKNTSPGESGINKTLLTQLPEISINRLTHIYNSSLSAGYFPDKWKHAIIRLIPKAGKTSYHPQNYRPISLLEVPGKILERVINNRLKSYLEFNNKYNDNQFGFRTGRGTTHALAIITEKIAQNKADKGQCQVIMRDVTKAFDKVWHLGLKYKIQHLQFPTSLEKFLSDFLSDRTASIKVENHTGRPFDLNCGVPQGSVLSPTLYTIYTNDIENSNLYLNILYADDITQIIGYPGKSKNMINRQAERAISSINSFEDKWKIETNLNKFTPIHIGAKRPTPLQINNNEIEFKNTGKCLGLTLTTSGYFKHIDERCNSANTALAKLYKLRNLPENIKTHLVKALILPILDFPPIPIHTLSKNQIRRLQKIQNKALRFAINQRYPYTMTTQQIHTHTNTIPLNIRLHNRAKDIWYRIENLDIPIYSELLEHHNNIQRFHRDFQSSLQARNNIPMPIY